MHAHNPTPYGHLQGSETVDPQDCLSRRLDVDEYVVYHEKNSAD